jgi:hypothetical protein
VVAEQMIECEEPRLRFYNFDRFKYKVGNTSKQQQQWWIKKLIHISTKLEQLLGEHLVARNQAKLNKWAIIQCSEESN